jgi:hypothetical protein
MLTRLTCTVSFAIAGKYSDVSSAACPLTPCKFSSYSFANQAQPRCELIQDASINSMTYGCTSNAHPMQCTFAIAGKYSDVSSGSGMSAAQIAHGALMLVAFCALMPAGMLLARHKWLFGDSEVRAQVLAGLPAARHMASPALAAHAACSTTHYCSAG